MKKNYWFLISVIIVGGLLLAMYLNTNTSKVKKSYAESDNSQNLPSITITETEILIQKNSTTDPTIPERKLSIYIDKNTNGTKDADEILCTLCKGEQILFGKTGNDGSFPVLSNINNLGLDTSGSVMESSLNNANITWGAFESKHFIVATSQIAFGDGAGDNFVPAYAYSAKIAGVNANIYDVQEINGGEMQYSFKTLVPIMQTSLQQAKTVYIKYSLNPEDTRYYISSGKLTSDGQKYFFKTKWNIEQSLKTGVTNSANISFYCL